MQIFVAGLKYFTATDRSGREGSTGTIKISINLQRLPCILPTLQITQKDKYLGRMLMQNLAHNRHISVVCYLV